MLKGKLVRLKNKIKALMKHDETFKTTKGYRCEWYGNTYGGFYVHPNNLNSQSIIYSFGIGEDISFDIAVINKHKCKVFGFDPTPKSVNWVKGQDLPGNFTFFDFGIDAKTGFAEFHLPKNKKFVSGSILTHSNVDSNVTISVPMKSFTDITMQLGHERINLLKMDIEGSEYEVIDSILSSSIQIDQIAIEIHERFFPDGKLKTKKLLTALKANGYRLFAVSDSQEELSFIKD